MPSTYSNLLYHIVFSTKDRERLIADDFKEELYRYMAGIAREEGGSLLEIGGIEDHVHLLAKFKPSIAVSDMLRLIKTNSSKWLHEEKKHARFGWQEGYAAFSVSESQMVAVRRYIRNQASHHRRQSFQ
jgi:REP element-mobilizing transposase RayT